VTFYISCATEIHLLTCVLVNATLVTSKSWLPCDGRARRHGHDLQSSARRSTELRRLRNSPGGEVRQRCGLSLSVLYQLVDASVHGAPATKKLTCVSSRYPVKRRRRRTVPPMTTSPHLLLDHVSTDCNLYFNFLTSLPNNILLSSPHVLPSTVYIHTIPSNSALVFPLSPMSSNEYL